MELLELLAPDGTKQKKQKKKKEKEILMYKNIYN